MGTLQVGGTTLGVKNTSTNKIDLSNAGDVNISGDITKDSLPMYACRAWVNFDGSDTSSANPLSFTNTNATNHGDANSAGETLCAIRGSGNVSKVVRNGTGDYTITFTTSMSDANYAISGCSQYQNNTGQTFIEGPSDASTSSVRVYNKNNSNSVLDAVFLCVQVFR